MENDWAVDDALLLKKNSRLKGCLLLLLCQIDKLANNKYQNLNNREGYILFLKNSLAELNLISVKLKLSDGLTVRNVKHASHDCMENLPSIIYHEFRNFFVHELNARDEFTSNILLNYKKQSETYFFKNGSVNLNGWSTDFGDLSGKWVVDVNWIIDLLVEVISNARRT